MELLDRMGAEFSLLVAGACWLLVGWWLWCRGWRIQRRYLIAADKPPLGRTTVTWTAFLVGALTIVAGHERPGLPALVVVAMVGTLAAWIDVRTHRLPTQFTLVMAAGVLIGWLCSFVIDDVTTSQRLWWSFLGALLWFVPLWCAHRVGGGLGFGDVRLAPVLGAMLGMLGPEPALTGLLVAVIGAGVAALWTLISGAGTTQSRMAMGPWLVAGALASHVAWGVIPDWLH